MILDSMMFIWILFYFDYVNVFKKYGYKLIIKLFYINLKILRK